MPQPIQESGRNTDINGDGYQPFLFTPNDEDLWIDQKTGKH